MRRDSVRTRPQMPSESNAARPTRDMTSTRLIAVDAAETQRTGTIVHAMLPEGCIVETQGILIALWLTALRAEHFAVTTRALFDAARRHPNGLSTLSIYRLDRRFPLQIGYKDSANEALQTLRAVREIVRVSASVVEFGGMEAIVVRTTIAALNAFSRSKPELATFDRVTDALAWLTPQTPEAKAPEALAQYLRVVRQMRDALAPVDAPERRPT